MITVGATLLTAVVVLPGCSFWAPNVVAQNYAPSDGLNADLQDLKVRNLLVVGDTAEGPGVVSGSLFNLTDEALTVTIGVGEASPEQSVDVPPNGYLTMVGAAASPSSAASEPAPSGAASADSETAAAPGSSGTEQTVQVDVLGVPAGATVPVSISSPAGGTVTLDTPVLAATNAYEGFLPAPPA